MKKSSIAIIDFALFFEKIKDRPEEHQHQLNIIWERVESNFRELSALSEKREKSMGSRLRELREGAQLYVNLNREATVLSWSIFAKDKKKLKELVDG